MRTTARTLIGSIVVVMAVMAVIAVGAAPPLAADEEADSEVDVRGGEIVFEIDGTQLGTGDAARFTRGETLESAQLAVIGFENVGGHHFTTILQGSAPEGADVGSTAEEIGEALLTEESYDAVDAAIGMANPYQDSGDHVLLEGPLTIHPEAPTGEWTLEWGVREVDVEQDPYRYGDAVVLSATHTFEVVDDEPRAGWVTGVLLLAAALAVVAGVAGMSRRAGAGA